jgi:hypothetical protein
MKPMTIVFIELEASCGQVYAISSHLGSHPGIIVFINHTYPT